jgi:branched-chain amino acid transport system ATP-binding protein
VAEALRLSGVEALYGGSHVLRGVSFCLGAGRLLVLLGRNGAGKTTCIDSIIGFLPPRQGEILLFGEPIARRAPEVIAAKGVGLVPQGRRLFPSLTVRENLLVAARPPRNGGPAWKLEDVYGVFPQLRARQHALAAHISGGEQQMVAIGRALLLNPRVLLLDEPSEGLAPQIVASLAQALLALKARGLSMVLVEQNTGLALKVADDVVLLDHGIIVHEGSAAELRERRELLEAHLGIV